MLPSAERFQNVTLNGSPDDLSSRKGLSSFAHLRKTGAQRNWLVLEQGTVVKLVARPLLLGYLLPAHLRKSIHSNLREEQVNLSGVQNPSVKSFQSSGLRLMIMKRYLSLALGYTVVKYGSKSRLRRDARPPAPAQPPPLNIYGLKEVRNDGYYGNHIFYKCPSTRDLLGAPHTSPNCNKVTEKANHLPSA